MTEVRLGVLRGGRVACGCLRVEVEEEVTCRELIDQLTEEDGGLSGGEERGAWHLVERWNGCERRLEDGDRVAEAVRQWESLGQGRVWLKFGEVTSSRKKMTSPLKKRKVDYLRGPLTEKKISRLKRDLRREGVAMSVRASSLWLWRLGQRRSLAGGWPLDPLRERLTQLRQQNLQLSTEISRLNIEAGGLSGQLQTARSEGRELSEGVRSVEEEVRTWRREGERESRARVADLQAEAIRLRRELETRNRLNSAQSSKLQSLKETLELKRASHKQQVVQSHDTHTSQPAVSHDQVTTPPPSKRGSPPDTPPSDGASHTPSSSVGGGRKRRAVFEARTRQQLEAEAEEFRRQRETVRSGQQSVRKLDFSSATPPTTPPDDAPLTLLPANVIEERKKLLVIPEADTHWYRTISDEPIDPHALGVGAEVKGESEGHTHLGGVGGDFFGEVMASVKRSVGGAVGMGKKRVNFSPEAIILTAALEGDLPTLKDCVEKLGGCGQTSHKGATCLHNAVCSGHLPCVQFLVEMGCDINTQDDDGWTALHCAVAYSSAEALAYLLSRGASLWLETVEEGETALGLGERELAAQREEGDEAGQEAAQLCLSLLQKAHSDMGVANGGVVYALFSREATETGELGLCEGERLLVRERSGEEWWEVEGEDGERGLVPGTFLGSTPRYQVIP